MKFHHASGMNITSFHKYCSTQIWLWENSQVVRCLVCSGTRLYLENVRNKVVFRSRQSKNKKKLTHMVGFG